MSNESQRAVAITVYSIFMSVLLGVMVNARWWPQDNLLSSLSVIVYFTMCLALGYTAFRETKQ